MMMGGPSAGASWTFDQLFDRIVRPESKSFQAYIVPQDRGFARMHQNEGVMPLTPEDRRSLALELADVLAREWSVADGSAGPNVYPELAPVELRRSYARELGVPEECLDVFPGSSDVLQTLAAGCFRPGSRVAFLDPSFSILHEMVKFWGAQFVPIRLGPDFEVLPESLFSQEVLTADVIILCTPNNPTGAVIAPEMIREVAARAQGLVVIDEAYAEFAKAWDPHHPEFLDLAVNSENVVALRTLSKAWGAAGLRVGALVAHPRWISFFSGLKHPYGISAPAQVLGTYLLNHKRPVMEKIVTHAVESCRSLSAALQEILQQGQEHVSADSCALRGVVYPSRANFLLIRTDRAARIAEECHARGVLVRLLELRGEKSFLRVSPWSSSGTEIFLEIFRKHHGGSGA